MAKRKPTPPGITLIPTLRLGNNDVPRCTFVKKNGKQCGKPARRGHDRCRTPSHGGANISRIGPANGNWKGGISTTVHGKRGRWTELLATPLQDIYLRAIRDPEILSLESEIALIDLQLDRLIKQPGNAEWDEVKRLVEACDVAIQANNRVAFGQSFMELRALANGAVDTDRAWGKINGLTDRRRVLVESERRRLVEQNMFMTREEAHRHASSLLAIITKHVTDREVLQAIISDWREVMEAGRRQPPDIDIRTG